MSKQLTQDGRIAVAELDDDIDPLPEPPDPPTISIDSPADGAEVVGSVPGIAVTLSGSGWTPFRSTRPDVKVQLGATDTFHPVTSVSTPNRRTGEFFWSHSAVTPIGGPLTVTAEVSINVGPGDFETLTGTHSIQLAVIDVPPVLNVLQPLDGELFTGTADGREIEVSGSASSRFEFNSNAIALNLDNGPVIGVATVQPDTTWSTLIQVPADSHTLKITCTDRLGNSTSITHNITVTVPTAILDVSLTSYLQALIEFATDPFNGQRSRITTDGNHNLTVDDLVQKFHQKFDQLPTFSAKANEPLHQIRLCIEVLRSYLASIPSNPARAAALAVEEGRYRQAAYFALLNQLGTSFDEIRTTPTATPEKRKSLADRLGISLGLSRPDNLDALFLDPAAPATQPNALTEQKLDGLFGLANTTRDPLQPDATAAFLGWKLAHLLQEWRERDFPLVPVENAPPIIDPDLLIKGDFKNAVLSDPAYALFKTRQDRVQQWLAELENQRVAAPSSLAALDAMLMSVLERQSAHLVALDDDQKQGEDISVALSAMKLDLPAFNYLVRVSRLLNATVSVSLLESEWNDVYNILIQVRKKQRFEQWREEEKSANANLSLSPNYFQSPEAMPFVRSTGTDASGSLLPEGAVDPNWIITAKPGATGIFPAIVTKAIAPPDWSPNRTSSRWISSQPNAGPGDAPGNYSYRTTFDLTGFDPNTVQLRMQISVADELIDVKLNNQSLGLRISGGPEASTGLQINSGFFSGINILEFIVFNAGAINSPTGIQAELAFVSVPQRLPLPSWRATPQARQEWEATLNGRIEQEKSVISAFGRVIDAAEEATLPLLRNALVAGIGKDGDWLTQRLLIDVKAHSTAQTTRLNQAIETVQSLFFGLRNSDPPVDLSDWELNRQSAPETNSEFDEQWNSIGSYAGWRAAMLVFLYPENLLIPTLRQANQHSSAFAEFLEALRAAAPLTRDAASRMVTDYLNRLPAPDSGFPPNLILPGFTISEQLSEAGLLAWANQIAGIWANKTEVQRRYLTEAFFDLPITLALQLQQAGDFETALAWYRIVYALDLPPDRRRIYPGLNEAGIDNNYDQTSQWLLDDSLNPHQFARQRADAYTRFTLLSIVRCLLSFADSEFTTDSFESLPRARSLYINAREVLDMPELSQPPLDDRVKMNPVIPALRARAEVNLFKLRTQRNIAGMQRQSPALNVQAGSLVLSNPSSDGSRVLAGNAGAGLIAPTQYRYATVIERAKQLVALAQQIEASFLASLEKRDAEAYNILKARQDFDLSNAQITLQDLRVTEAADGVVLAELQQDGAQFQVDHYQSLLQHDLNGFEIASMACLGTQLALQAVAATQSVIAAGGQAILGFLTFGLLAPDAAGKGADAAQAIGSFAGLSAGILDKMAGYERRYKEWQFQHDSAMRDRLLSDQQHQLAMDQEQVVLQEQAIANTQQQHAQATLNFLATKFTNVELYEYMSGILQGVYSYFLQQAAAMARLAQNQLAFERQEATLSFIQADYWQTPSSGTNPSQNNSPDRRGLTGSARLLQDIYQLDQHAFATNQRKLQLTKSISLAQMAPFEFQKFRQSGVLPFALPRQLFDQDFPGHYLRLIRRVRTSVIALIPPVQGIKATLANTGVSRTTIGGDVFQDVIVRRDPQAVALTSPINATGLFELDTQPELLLPFEGLGVDTSWEFQMPKPANFIDYDAIADVLITIEYTALSDSIYRDQVIQRLDRNFTADRAFSFQQQLSDQWYDLHNPEQVDPARRFRAEFSTANTDFPINLERDSLKISNLVVYFVPKDGEDVKVTTAGLRFVPEGATSNAPPLGGDAASDRGLLSTRSGSASSWTNCIGVAPFGKWTLDLSRDPELQSLLAADKVRDILFVLSYAGRTPAWPN